MGVDCENVEAVIVLVVNVEERMGVGESSGIFVKFVPMFGDDLVMGDFVVFYDV